MNQQPFQPPPGFEAFLQSFVQTQVAQQLQIQEQRLRAEFSQAPPHNVFEEKPLADAFTRLLPSQQGALLSIQKSETKHMLLVMHTGCGKSGVIACAPYFLRPSPRKVLVIAPDVQIRDQLRDTMLGTATNAPFIKDKAIISQRAQTPSVYTAETKPAEVAEARNKHITVANIHKFNEGWKKRFNNDLYDLVIIDEAHHYPAKSWLDVIKFFSKARIIFLTATPFRKNEVTDRLPIAPIFKYGYKQATQAKLIKPLNFELIQAEAEIDLKVKQFKTRRFKRAEALEHAAAAKTHYYISISPQVVNAVAKAVVERLHALNQGAFKYHQAIVQVSKKYDAERVVEVFEEMGVKAKLVYSSLQKQKKESVMKEFDKSDSSIRVMVVCGMLGEGYDNPKISVAACLSNKKSLRLFMQFVGRGVRKLRNGSEFDQQAYIIAHELLPHQDLYKRYMNEEEVELEWEYSDDEEDDDQEDEDNNMDIEGAVSKINREANAVTGWDALDETLQKLNKCRIPNGGAGRCLFLSLLQGMESIGLRNNIKDDHMLRTAIVNYLQLHQGLLTNHLNGVTAHEYLTAMRQNETYGGEPELAAFTSLTGIGLRLYQARAATTAPVQIGPQSGDVLELAYNGNHYEWIDSNQM